MTLLSFLIGFISVIGVVWVLSMCRSAGQADRCAACALFKWKLDAQREEMDREEQAMKAASTVILPTTIVQAGPVKGAIPHNPPILE